MTKAMTMKSSASLTDKQRAFARTLAENGGHTTVGAVLEHIIDLLRELLEREELKRAAPSAPPARGRKGEPGTAKGKKRRAPHATAAKRRSHGPPSRGPH